MSDPIDIHINNIDALQAGLQQAPEALIGAIDQAGQEAADRVILDTEGLKRYPPLTPANYPPTPYYIRGRGTELKRGNKYNSERLGSQFYVRSQRTSTYIGNRASYADYVVGEKQAMFMGIYGWRKLAEVAEEKLKEIEHIYQSWIDLTLKQLGL